MTGSKAAQKLRRDAEILSEFPTIQLEFAHQRLFAASCIKPTSSFRMNYARPLADNIPIGNVL
jgi:hypothetical protein